MARISVSVLCVAVLCAGLGRAAEQGQLDYSPVLFSVMAAYDAAAATGPNASRSPASGLRAEVRSAVLARNPAVLKELRQFFYEHRKSDPGADLGQYISFALSTADVPEFKPRLTGGDVPPDVQPLFGFSDLLARFYREAGLDTIWTKVQPAYERALESYHEPVARTVLETNGYLRNPTSGYMGRRFQIYVELLAPASQVHTRSYKDDYFVVVTPPVEARVDDIRHAYLHYLLDPLATKYFERIHRARGLLDYAQGAPALDETYKADFLLLATESLIKAVEARLSRRPAAVQQALEEGFVLTPFFAEHLPAYEKQEAAMRLYLPEMLDAIDLRKEDKRLQKVQFAAEKAPRKAIPPPAPVEPESTPGERQIEEAEKLYSARNLDAAREAYLKLTRQVDDKSIHARAYFGLARIATLKSEAELAQQLFRKTLELSPDPYTRSWSEVYLGRLAEAFGEKDQAAQHYKAALSVESAPPGARQAAEEGVQKLTTR